MCTADKKIYDPAIDISNNRLSTSDVYTFDSAGNTTKDAQLRKFTYDAENKQTKVETVNSGGTVTGTLGEYYYDGDGKRVKKVSATETTIFVYDASGKEVAEYSTALAATPQVSYLTSDHLGSPRINTNENGAVIARHDYQPFGEEIATSQRNTGLGYNADEVRKKFTLYERDGETDLDFAKARYFDFGFGRFTSPDPLMASAKKTDPQTLNRYIYVGNNPLTYIDPNGKEKLYKADGTFLGKTGTNDDIRIVKKSEISKVEKAFKNSNTKKSEGILSKVVTSGSYGVYNSADDAANAWGQAYNRDSIKKGKEFIATIIKLNIGGKTVITYTEPDKGSNDESTTSVTTNAVADIHSHGKYEKNYDNNNFSPEDKADNDKTGLVGYLTTPDGSLKKYDPASKKETVVNTSQPSDEKDPNRQNTIQ